jgi:AcrR family transcriptional regulator
MKTKKQVVSAFRRAEIVDAARRVFARKGFARGIIDDIADEAKMAKGTVYLYFSSKEEIYRVVMDVDMEFLSRVTLENVNAAKTLEEKIRAFALVRLENCDAKREFFQIMDSDPGHLSYSRSQYRNWMKQPVLSLAGALEDAVKQGEIRAVSAERVAWLVADITRGTIQRRLVGPAETTPAEDADFIVDFVRSALKK